ncbi:MAG: hypothetical protein RBQ71_02495 [Acholeplasmataceae bacterium]|nr:hypothetical protein [Acholeplasmataceae bacterium]
MLKRIILSMLIFSSILVFYGCQNEEIEQPEIIYHKIAAGADFSLFIDEQGDLFGMGSQIYGLLANGITENMGVLEPISLNTYFNLANDETFLSVHAGERNALALTSKMRLFSWGWNVIGQTGTGQNGGIVSTPVDISDKLTLADDETIVQIQTGRYHTILLTSKGRVFGWGLNSNGEIGTSRENVVLVRQEVALSPVETTDLFKLKRNEIITHIGLHQAVTSKNRYLAWGPFGIDDMGFRNNGVNDMSKNLDFLEEDEYVEKLLGNGAYILTNKNHVYKTSILTAFIYDRTQTVVAYQNISFLMQGVTGKPIIVEQRDNIIMVQSNRKVFAYGLNAFGVFGAGHDVRLTFFRITPNERDIEYVYEDVYWDIDWQLEEMPMDVSLSLYHTMMITNHNRIFIWGRNLYGELGNGTQESLFTPEELIITR